MNLLFESVFLTKFFIVIGICATLNYLYINFHSFFGIAFYTIWDLIYPRGKKSFTERYGEWAVITGSTDGIGKGYAQQLASQGMNIVLISRTKSKLELVASEIQAKYPVAVKWIEADFGNGESVYPIIEKGLAGINVGMLVNNIGIYHDCAIDTIPFKHVWDYIYCNIGAATVLTRLVIPTMIKNGKGAIINISSGTEIMALPWYSLYTASKAYITHFTVAIQAELSVHKNITVQLVSPLTVITNLVHNQELFASKRYDKFMVTVNKYAKFAVNTIGKTKRTTGYWMHGIQLSILKLIPKRIFLFIAYWGLNCIFKKIKRKPKAIPLIPNNV